MNIELFLNTLKSVEMLQVIAIIFSVLSIGLIVYNILYINQSLHITSSHMGIKAPRYLKSMIKIGIFITILSALFSISILITSFY